MASYTVYVNKSNFTEGSSTGTVITTQAPLDVKPGDTVTFKVGADRTAPTSVSVSPGSPPLFPPPNNTGFTVPASGISLTVAGGAAVGNDYTLTVPDVERDPVTGGIKVNN